MVVEIAAQAYMAAAPNNPGRWAVVRAGTPGILYNVPVQLG